MLNASNALGPVRNRTDVDIPSSFVQSEFEDESILIYVAVSGGTMIPLRVLESDSIESVKLRIQSCQGFVVKKQKLVCGGRELARNDSLVKDYGVADGNVLHLVLRLSDLQLINVKTVSGKEFTLNVDRGRDVGYVKQQICKKEKGLLADFDEQEVLCDGERLDDQKRVNDICKRNDAVIHLLVRRTAKVRFKPIKKDVELSIVAPQVNDNGDYGRRVNREENQRLSYENKIGPGKVQHRDFTLAPVVTNSKVELSQSIKDLINSTYEGLDSGRCPMMSMEGTGGAYFMLSPSGQRYVSIFKPMDEEPMAVYNPRGLPLSSDGEGLKKGTKVGEGALREVAAYILDHPKSGQRSLFGDGMGFAGVPPTVLVKCLHKGFNNPKGLAVKIGSLQMFMENDGSCEDMGPRAFPVMEVHKISVLDIRLANTDRHAGNILLSKGEDKQTVLIPIDHGYCLPECFEDCTFDWLLWPQARQPYSPEIIDYIRSLDAEEDIALLKFYGWDMSLECARTLHVSTMLLKKGAERGLTPFAIGSIMCRETLKKESVIEEIVREAKNSVVPGSGEDLYLQAVSQIMDRRLDEIAV